MTTPCRPHCPCCEKAERIIAEAEVHEIILRAEIRLLEAKLEKAREESHVSEATIEYANDCLAREMAW